MDKLPKNFYQRNAVVVAKELLGKNLVHRVGAATISGKIVEVEAYVGAVDKAAHSYNSRRTPRTEVMFGPGGYAYIYFIYGMYYCMNVVTGPENDGQAVLIRALEPAGGVDQMAKNRFGKSQGELTKKQRILLTNGPGKLCSALGITKENYGEDLTGDRLYIGDDNEPKKFQVVSSKRINIGYAQEAQDYLWRFYIKENPYISK